MGAVDTTYTFTATDTITSAKMNNIIDQTTMTSSAIIGTTLEVTSGQLKVRAQGITSNELALNSVVTAKIENEAVITEKISNSAVTTIKLENSTSSTTGVTTAKIADSNVTQAKLAANVVGNGPLFRAYKNATQSISTATDTIVSFQVEQHDTNNNFSSNQFTPSIEGYYMLTASVGLTLAADELSVQIQKNGAAYDFSERSSVPSYRTRLTTLMYMNGSTDSARVIARQLEGVSRTIDDDPAVTSFSGCLIRSA
jgi:hypothetical protein